MVGYRQKAREKRGERGTLFASITSVSLGNKFLRSKRKVFSKPKGEGGGGARGMGLKKRAFVQKAHRVQPGVNGKRLQQTAEATGKVFLFFLK